MPQSISGSPSPTINSRPYLRVVRDEEAAPYDGQTKTERQGEAGHFTSVSDDVLDAIALNLGLAALGLYAYLERRANRAGICEVSYNRIADDTKASRRHIIDLLKVLADAGYVTVTTPKDARQNHKPNVIRLPFHRAELVQDMHQPSERASERASAYPAPKVDSKYSPSNAQQKPPLDDASNERLQTFKLAYPVKRRSANARALAQEWAPLTIAEQEAAIASLAVFTKSEQWQEDGGRYIPNIVKFLNERRWESVPPSQKVSIRPGDYGYYGTKGWDEFKQAVKRGEIPGVTPAMVEARA